MINLKTAMHWYAHCRQTLLVRADDIIE